LSARAARLAALSALFLLSALASTAAAAATTVNIQGFAFSPATVSITVGDTVTWTNKDAAAHSAVVAGVGQTQVLAQNQSGSLTFNTVGTFPYICGIHLQAMMGTVIVRAAATAPPTPQPTVAPTAVRTVAPTTEPTASPTTTPTIEPTPSASPSPTVAATAEATAAPTATLAPVAAARPSQVAPARTAASDSSDSTPLLIGGAVLAFLAVAAVALARMRR